MVPGLWVRRMKLKVLDMKSDGAVRRQIFYVNHSANFFLYCITGRRFRAALRAVFGSTDVDTFQAARRCIANNPRLVAAVAVGVGLAPTDGHPLSSTTYRFSSSSASGLVRSRSAEPDTKSVFLMDDKRPRTRSFWVDSSAGFAKIFSCGGRIEAKAARRCGCLPSHWEGQTFFGFWSQNVFWLKPVEKISEKPAPNLTQFQFVMPVVVIKDFFMFVASNDQKVINLQILDNLKYWRI